MYKLKIKWCGDIETLWGGHPRAEMCMRLILVISCILLSAFVGCSIS